MATRIFDVPAIADEFRCMRYWTDEYRPEDRFPIWKRLLTTRLLNVEANPLGAEPFRADVLLRVLPDVRFGWGSLTPTSNVRTREIVAEDNDDLILLVNLDGALVAQQDRRRVELAPGDGYLLACSERGEYSMPVAGKLLCVRMRHDALASRVHDVFTCVGRLIPGKTESLPLLINYVRLFDNAISLASPKSRELVSAHVHDLVAQVVSQAHLATAKRADGVRAARLAAIKAFIDKNIAQHGLSVDVVAERFGVSPRNIQRLFGSEGTTFSAFLLTRRLAQAYELLVDPRQRSKNIGDIALACGFGDVSYFNRTFRARYGTPPSSVRQHEAFRGDLSAANI